MNKGTFLARMAVVFFVSLAAAFAQSAQGIAADGIYGVGVQFGMAEMGAYAGVDPATLAKGLEYAHGLALASGCIPTDEIDQIHAAMLATSNSRTLFSRISAYRQNLATYILEHCSCGAGSSNQLSTNATITVITATYGAACRVPAGNDTANLSRQCNGRSQCGFVVSNARPGGDPASGCAKDYVAEYRCSDGSVKKVSHNPSTDEGYTVVLDCGGSSGNTGGANLTYETNSMRRGSDYRDFGLPAAQPELCRDACAADSACMAYGYTKPGAGSHGSTPWCYLKNNVPERSNNSCCVAGVKTGAR